MAWLEHMGNATDSPAPLLVEPTNESPSGPCHCCGSVTRRVEGLVRENGSVEALYAVEWTAGSGSVHETHFLLMLGGGTDRRGVSLQFQLVDGEATYRVADASARNASSASFAGRLLRRDEVIGTPLAQRSFEVVDAIWAQDRRLAELAQTEGYVCHTCGERHAHDPTCFIAEWPQPASELTAEERQARVERSSDQCIIDGARFFMLGNLDIPVRGRETGLCWTVWVEMVEEHFVRASDLWTTPGRESEAPYAARLVNQVPGYPPCVDLEVRVHTQPVGLRPRLALVDPGQRLAREQQDGISPERADELVHIALAR
jgi:hypothetical protein